MRRRIGGVNAGDGDTLQRSARLIQTTMDGLTYHQTILGRELVLAESGQADISNGCNTGESDEMDSSVSESIRAVGRDEHEGKCAGIRRHCTSQQLLTSDAMDLPVIRFALVGDV
jgi:hypothetical protein